MRIIADTLSFISKIKNLKDYESKSDNSDMFDYDIDDLPF